MAVLSVKSGGGIWAGDLVVWAQEHLVGAGQPVQREATVSRRPLRLAVPWSARLPARRYEIPRDLGAGRPPR